MNYKLYILDLSSGRVSVTVSRGLVERVQFHASERQFACRAPHWERMLLGRGEAVLDHFRVKPFVLVGQSDRETDLQRMRFEVRLPGAKASYYTGDAAPRPESLVRPWLSPLAMKTRLCKPGAAPVSYCGEQA